VWTVNAAHDLSALVALGVDAVITDNLVEAVAIARARLR
jgi:glycerophosphoryl diester phosphodiesterase